jgi:hypothetical protein
MAQSGTRLWSRHCHARAALIPCNSVPCPLENVILPEISSERATMEEHLDLNEQEEVIRVRSIRRRE